MLMAATEIDSGRRVVIKYLPTKSISNPETVERFKREASTLRGIGGPHGLVVLDIGQMTGGEPYMVMEYLEGRTLADEITARGPLAEQEALEILGQICEALASCHKKKVVHRDLGPHNVFLETRQGLPPRVKLIDFGIVKVSGALASKKDLTGQGAVMGSPQHIPPEQMVSAANVDQRGDIWSAGSVLFTMLAGHPPFQGDTLPMLCTQVMNHPTPSILKIRPGLNDGVERTVMRCMEKDRDARYRDVGQLVDALVSFAPELASHAAEVHRVLEDRIETPAAPKRVNMVLIAALGGVVLLIVIVIVALKPW